MKKEILFIGAFKLPQNGFYGGVYHASTTMRDEFKRQNYHIIELNTSIKDINNTKVSSRLFSLINRMLVFCYKIIINRKAKVMLVFISAGNSYLDKLIPITIAKILRKKVFVFPRSGHIIEDLNKKKYQLITKSVFSMSDYIICQSEFWKVFFGTKFELKDEKLIIVENWVQDEVREKSTKLNFPQFNLGKDVFKIIFVSRIEVDKGVDDILKVVSKLKQHNIKFKINIYGAGGYTNTLIKRIEKERLTNFVSYKGWLSKENKLDIINKHHLALFPSKTEGYPNSILDYVFAKVPVITSDIPMLRMIGKSNFIYYQNGNIEELYNAIHYSMNKYSLTVENATTIFKRMYEENNIKYAFNKLESIL